MRVLFITPAFQQTRGRKRVKLWQNLFAQYAVISMTKLQAIRIMASSPAPFSQTFPMIGSVLSAALARKTSKKRHKPAAGSRSRIH